MFVNFIWGAGGVGKSHYAIRAAALDSGSKLLISMDPSQRVFELLSVPKKLDQSEVKLDEFQFTIKRTDQNTLFEQLFKKKPGNPKVRAFYDQMVAGLQDFRDYLSLIQLSDELSRSEFSTIIVDTPPFQEAIGLHKKVFDLKHFFDSGLVQFALKTTSFSLVNVSLKKVFEVARIFIGKNAAEKVFDFIEWLTFHTERFKSAASYLETLIFSERTKHHFVFTPETPIRILEDIEAFFSKNTIPLFIMNRSVSSFTLPKEQNAFTSEINQLKKLEVELLKQIKKKFPEAEVKQIPMILMGDDTAEELVKFIRAR